MLPQNLTPFTCRISILYYLEFVSFSSRVAINSEFRALYTAVNFCIISERGRDFVKFPICAQSHYINRLLF